MGLTLSRKVGERILVGDRITITVVRIGPNNVRLGIDAPRDMNIVREELLTEPSDAEKTPPTTFDVSEPLPESAWNRSIEVREQEEVK